MLNNSLVEKSLIEKGQVSSLSGNKPFIFSVLKKAALVCALSGIVMGVASGESYAASKEKTSPVVQAMCKDFTGVNSIEDMLVGVGAYAKVGQTVKYKTDSCHLEITPIYSKGGFKINSENSEETLRAYALKTETEYKIAVSLETQSLNKIPGTNLNSVNVEIVSINSDEIAFDETVNSKEKFNIGGYTLSSNHFNINNTIFGNTNLPENERFDEARTERDSMEIVQGIIFGFNKHTEIQVMTRQTPDEKQKMDKIHDDLTRMVEYRKNRDAEDAKEKKSLFSKIFDAVFEKEEKPTHSI